MLWTSSIVPQVHLGGVHAQAVFGSSVIAKAHAYEWLPDLLWVLSAMTRVAVLAVFSVYGVRLARASVAEPITTGMLLGVLGVALQWLAAIPFQELELWWDRRHGLSRTGYVAAAFGNLLGLGSALLVIVSLLVVMLAARRFGDRWWLIASPFFVGFAALSILATPYLVPGLHPAHEARLERMARAVAREEHVHAPLEIQDVSATTSLPNAEAVGLGPTRRVVLWSSMLDGRFNSSELRVVLAHEYGHQARGHLWKDIAWYALFLIPIAYAISRIVRRRGGMSTPEAVPLALLALTVLQLLVLPLRNAVSRHMEAEADWMALQTTRDPAAARALFKQFAVTSLADPDPPTWAYILLDDHPTLAQRVAMAGAWRGPHQR